MNDIYTNFIQELTQYDIDGDKRITAALVPCGSPEESKAMLAKQHQELQEFGYVKTLACASEEYNKIITRIQELFFVSKQAAFIFLGILDQLDGIPGAGVNVEKTALQKYALNSFVSELTATIQRIKKNTKQPFTIPLNDYGVLEIETTMIISELETLRTKLMI